MVDDTTVIRPAGSPPNPTGPYYSRRKDDFGDNLTQQTVERSSISWRAIFAGAFIALLCDLILTSLGFAIGASSLSGVIQGKGGGSALTVGSGVWLVITTFISLFVGSYFGGRIAGLITTRIGAAQGLVITALFFGFMVSTIGTAVGFVGSGVGSAVGAIGGAAGDIAKNPQVQDTVNSALGDMNLKSPPDQVAQGVATRLLRGDTDGATRYLANQAGVSQAEAKRRIDKASADIQTTAKDVGTKAAKAAATAAWTMFGMLLLGSLFSALGGSAGARAHLREPITEREEEFVNRRAA